MRIFSLRPIKLIKLAIFKKKPTNFDAKLNLHFEEINKTHHSLIENKDFKRNLKKNYKGYLAFDNEGHILGYYWYTINRAPPTIIPWIPNNVVWIFNMYVNKEFRNKGYQKQMLIHFEKTFRNYNELYADVRLDNYPSISNFLKLNYIENGIYYVLVIGFRFKNLYFTIKYWDKNRKHIYNNV